MVLKDMKAEIYDLMLQQAEIRKQLDIITKIIFAKTDEMMKFIKVDSSVR